MAKLEYTPVLDWQRFNFLGKRLFDFVNLKLNATTGAYVGNGLSGKEIQIDIIPKCMIIFKDIAAIPVIWIDSFIIPNSKDFNGNNLSDAIIGITAKKDKFILGNNSLVNSLGVSYSYIVFGS